ncbi:type II toxin-antitoxin system RelE/ParE family toxin [Mucilaginibacter pedocola]|uniref:Plasmid stabilization protein n=1 Tax=Mucilaginibacter pedocola TaxID=1792845 RepID=A0A1S9PJZ7_9SPHI|nr:type II toxin-antitoxin system RelE/ParE family toxin [Mucilaginibacter pedocola]OOQ61272.1 plasmid stabilization protein [Mucilaginibacter pedocola]
MVKINWTRRAIKDVNSIAEYIARDSEYYAKIQASRFFEAVKVLDKHPLRGKIVPEKQNPLLREIQQGSYRIIYRIVSESKIDIISVHHSKMLLRNNPNLK